VQPVAPRQLTWTAPVLAAALTAFATIGLTMSVRVMRGSIHRPAAVRVERPDIRTQTSDEARPLATEARPSISTAVPNRRAMAMLGAAADHREVAASTLVPNEPLRETPRPTAPRPSIISTSAEARVRSEQRIETPFHAPPHVATPVLVADSIAAAPLANMMMAASVPVEPHPAFNAAASSSAIADPAASTALPRTAPSETRAIQEVLRRYRTAFSDLDAAAARAVWPTADAKALRRAFDALERQVLTFKSCEIAVANVHAVASCGGTAQFVPKVGNRSRHDERLQWEFNLRKVDDVWQIDTVSAR
jgi:hypothetical protein